MKVDWRESSWMNNNHRERKGVLSPAEDNKNKNKKSKEL